MDRTCNIDCRSDLYLPFLYIATLHFMDKRFTSFLQSWWQPMLLYFISVCLCLFVSWNNYNPVVPFARLICIIALLLLLISGIFLLWQKKWLRSILPLGIFIVSICATVFFFAAAFILKGITDSNGFGKGLTIPDSIQISDPVRILNDNIRPDSILQLKRANPDFELYSSFQPGLYEYDFWVGKIEKGKIYLKVFEITKGTALSANRLPVTTAVEVFNPTDSVVRYSTQNYFTIYEGDWGDPYAARFEVWFMPAEGSAHRQLFSKNYKIEGWMH
jgi:hypothetical protein